MDRLVSTSSQQLGLQDLAGMSVPQDPFSGEVRPSQLSLHSYQDTQTDDYIDFGRSQEDLLVEHRNAHAGSLHEAVELQSFGSSSTEAVAPTSSLTASTGRLSGWWIFELACLIISIACVATIASSVWNGEPLTSYDFYFSLNTMVGFLGSTIARTAIVFAVSSAIGQAKWIWFRNPLITFDLVDGASRGPKGSAELIFYLKGWHLLLLGCVAVMLSLLMEPTLQALIVSHGQLEPVEYPGGASIPRASRLDGGFEAIMEAANQDVYGNDYPVVSTSPDFAINAALFEGLGSEDPSKLQNVSVSCVTGNCTWQVFVSLGVCSSCFDVSSHLVKRSISFLEPDVLNEPDVYNTATFTGNGTQYTLPHLGLHINNLDGPESQAVMPMYMTAGSTADPGKTINFQVFQTLLAAITTVRATDEYVASQTAWEDAMPVATECSLFLCLKAYHSSSQLGLLHEEVVRFTSTRVPASWQPLTDPSSDPRVTNMSALGNMSWTPVNQDNYVLRSDFQLDSSGMAPSWYSASQQFNASQTALDSTVNFLTSFLPVAINPEVNTSYGVYRSGDVLTYPSIILQPLWNSTNLTFTFDTLAKSSSNAIRKAGNGPAQGQTCQYVFRYKVRWFYFTVPVVVLLIGSIFTIATIIETRKAKLASWKNSSLATMTYGPDETTRRYLRRICRTQKLEKACSGMVYLREEQDGVELAAYPPLHPHQDIDASTQK